MTEQHGRYLDDDGEERDFFKDPELQKAALLRTLSEVQQGLGLCAVRGFIEYPDTEELFPNVAKQAREARKQAGAHAEDILDIAESYIGDIAEAVRADRPFRADQAYHELAPGAVRRTFTLPAERITVTEYKDERAKSKRQNTEFHSTVTYSPDNGQKVSIEYALRRVQVSNDGEVEETRSFSVGSALDFSESETRWPKREQCDADSEDEVTKQRDISTTVTLGGMLSSHPDTQTGWRSAPALASLKQASTALHEAHHVLVSGDTSS